MAEPEYDILADVYRRLFKAGLFHVATTQFEDSFHGRSRIEEYVLPTEDGVVDVRVTYPQRKI